MEILSGANKSKDIVSKEYVDGQINNHVHDADEIPCNTKVLKLGSKEYKISENLQKALENLLDYVYMNASGVLDLQTNLKSVSDTVSKIPSYKGGTGISVAGDTIGHSNNTLPGMVGTGEILTPDFGDTVYTTWFSYDAQGHVTQSGTGGFVIPTIQTDDALSNTSTNPLQNKIVKAKFDAVDSQISSLSTDNGNLWARVKTKADNTAEGATALLGNLSESNIALGDEDEVIIKNLNQYTHRPLTKLFDWIKASLAKVATSGSYSDLNDKPTLGNVAAKTIKTATTNLDTGFVSVAESQKYVPDMAFLSFWNGSYTNKGSSNLKYCNKGAFGTAATKDVDTAVTSGSTNLVTSGGVAAALSKKVGTTSNTIVPTWWCGTDTANTTGYYHFMTVTMSQHEDFNMTLLITNEFGYRYVGIFNTHIRCDSGTTTNAPDHMDWLVRRGWAANAIIAVVSGLTVKYYINQVVPQFSGICFKALNVSSRRGNNTKYTTVFSTAPTTGLKASATSGDNSTVSNATKWNGLTDDTMTENTTDTRLMVLNGNKVQHRQIDTLPFLSSDDLAQPVLYTSTTATTSATITGLFANYSLVWFRVVGSKTTHTHILPLAYLKSKGSLTFKDSGTPINILYVSDTQIRWFEYQGQGAETYTSVTIVKII